MSEGFKIVSRSVTIDEAILTAYQDIEVAAISDVMNRMSAAGAELRPYHGKTKLVGRALTVKTRPGDNLMVHKALNMASKGDVIVVDAGGDLTNAIIGGLMISYANSIGVSGFVINGAVRDLDDIENIKLPVYAAGITHRGPYKDGPGEINVPINLGGMVVNPGDLIVGDQDGVLSIRHQVVEDILNKAKAKMAAEKTQFKEIAEGTSDRSWVEETLRQKGVNVDI